MVRSIQLVVPIIASFELKVQAAKYTLKSIILWYDHYSQSYQSLQVLSKSPKMAKDTVKTPYYRTINTTSCTNR